jgi:hypothetical protein
MEPSLGETAKEDEGYEGDLQAEHTRRRTVQGFAESQDTLPTVKQIDVALNPIKKRLFEGTAAGVLGNEMGKEEESGTPRAKPRPPAADTRSQSRAWDKTMKIQDSLVFLSKDNGLDSRSGNISITLPKPYEDRARHRRKVALEDVLQRHPLESEAETRVLAAVEDLDPGLAERPRLSSVGSGILPHVPTGAEGAFDPSSPLSSSIGQGGGIPNSRQQGAIQDRAAVRSNKDHRRKQTMEQRLDGLNDALEAIHDETILDSAKELLSGSSDVMNKHARDLYQRRTKVGDNLEGSMNTAKKRWKKALAAVYVSGSKDDDGNGDGDASTHEATQNAPDSPDPDVPDVEAGEENMPGESNSQHPTVVLAQDSISGKIRKKIPWCAELVMFWSAQKLVVMPYLTAAVIWIVLPAWVSAFVLFFFAGNPPTGRIDRVASERNSTLINHLGEAVDPNDTSASWLILFMCIRQLVTLSLAKATQLFMIDFFYIGKRFTSKLMGPVVTLVIVQSRGWPFIVLCWSLFNFGMNYGTHKVRPVLTSSLMFLDIDI